MKNLLIGLVSVIAINTANANDYRMLATVTNKETGEKIQIECSKKMCDEIYINKYNRENTLLEELNYIPLFNTEFLAPLSGGEYKNWKYKGATGLFRKAGDVLQTSAEFAAMVSEPVFGLAVNYSIEVLDALDGGGAGIMVAGSTFTLGMPIALVIAPAAVLFTAGAATAAVTMAPGATAAAGLATTGLLVGVGETMFYIGSDVKNGIVDKFNKQARALKGYRRIISGDKISVKQKVFSEIEKLVRE